MSMQCCKGVSAKTAQNPLGAATAELLCCLSDPNLLRGHLPLPWLCFPYDNNTQRCFWLVSTTIKLLINVCEDFRVTLRLNVLNLFLWRNKGLNKQPDPKLIIWLLVQEYVVLCEYAVLGLKVVQISGETQFALTNHLWVRALLVDVGEHALHENSTAKFKKYYLRIKVILRKLKLNWR